MQNGTFQGPLGAFTNTLEGTKAGIYQSQITKAEMRARNTNPHPDLLPASSNLGLVTNQTGLLVVIATFVSVLSKLIIALSPSRNFGRLSTGVTCQHIKVS
ncbi:hypothetical protein Hanom_Chr12g01086071 [Helianthus anomalus]